MQKVGCKIISTRLGHSIVGFTMDTYTHLLPGMQESAMEKFEKALIGWLADSIQEKV